MTNHTPGPWTLGDRLDQNGRLNPNGSYVGIDAKGHWELAIVVWQMKDDKKHNDDLAGSDKCRANAHLMIAAPDLLAALKAACNELPKASPNWAIAQAAIAKAEQK